MVIVGYVGIHVVQVWCLVQLTCYGAVWCVGCEELVVYVRCVCVWLGVWRGGVVLCLYEVRVWILCVDGRSRYMYIVIGGYLRI